MRINVERGERCTSTSSSNLYTLLWDRPKIGGTADTCCPIDGYGEQIRSASRYRTRSEYRKYKPS